MRGGVPLYAAQGDSQSDAEIAEKRRFRTGTSPKYSWAVCFGRVTSRGGKGAEQSFGVGNHGLDDLIGRPGNLLGRIPGLDELLVGLGSVGDELGGDVAFEPGREIDDQRVCGAIEVESVEIDRSSGGVG